MTDTGSEPRYRPPALIGKQAMRVNPKWKKGAGFQTLRGRVLAVTDTPRRR